MKLTLGFSPCPNDTFMFDAMVHGKIDTEDIQFDVVMTDVEELNKKAFKAGLDITKISFHAFAYVAHKYVLLDSGSALGKSCGPILISKYEMQNSKPEISNLKIAIPGKYTTANFLLSLAFPGAKNKTEMLFSEIEDAVIAGKADAGLIIHENRFTYQQKGLKKIIDLGEYWEDLTRLPIPLGGIVVKRNLPNNIQHKLNRIMQRSIEYAFRNPLSSKDFVKQHAQEMNDEVIMKHIRLYVNEYSFDLGDDGREAIQTLMRKAEKLNIIPEIRQELFLQL